MANPLIRKMPRMTSKGTGGHKSAGILDDFAVMKVVHTKEGTIEKVPIDDSDIVNKKYVDDNAASTGGNNGEVQFNENGTFQADDTLFWDNVNKILEAKNIKFQNTTFESKNGIIYKDSKPFLHDFNYGDNGTVTTVGENVFVGRDAGNLTMGSTATNAEHGSYNAFIGDSAGKENTIGRFNTFIGSSSGFNNTSGMENTFVGRDAGQQNTIGRFNIFFGSSSGFNNTSGMENTFVGIASGYSNKTGHYNTMIGRNAGIYLSDGSSANETSSSSIFIGRNTKSESAGSTNQIIIGNEATGLGSNSVVIGNDDIIKTVLKGDIGIGTTLPTEKLDVNSNAIRIRTAQTPASATATGTQGMITWDADYIYVCIATDTWKRTAISTW